jgi:hypothetical protein
LLSEVHTLEQAGIEVRSRVTISEACPLILAHHAALDLAREAAKGAGKIGTTGRGIGPAYEDKIARRALRVQDLFYPDRFAAKLERVLEYHNFVLTQYFKCAVRRMWLPAFVAALHVRPHIMPMVVPPIIPPALDPRQRPIGPCVDRILHVGVFGPRSVSLGSNQRQRGEEDGAATLHRERSGCRSEGVASDRAAVGQRRWDAQR